MGQQETAKQIWDYLTSRGWTKQSVSALLGNMQSESSIIADSWESGIVGNMNGGYGLVQWTPATKYIDWAKSNGLVYQDVISQCKRLEWEVANSQQFYHPTMTFAQFTKSTQSPEELADIFIRYYERPLNPNQPARGTQARYWYSLFQNTTGGSATGSIEKLIERMIYWCTEVSLGYDQSNRWDIRDGGETDCSALVIHCLQEAGFATGAASYTGNMRSALIANGWAVVANNGSPQTGDILLNDVNHVAVYIGNGKLAQASGDENGQISGGQAGDQTGRETNINSYYNYPWDCYLRWQGENEPNMEELKDMLKLFKINTGYKSLQLVNTDTLKYFAMNADESARMRKFLYDKEPMFEPAEFQNVLDIIKHVL